MKCDLKSISALQEIFRRERLSFLQYIRESFPWVSATQADHLVKFRKLAEGDRVALDHLGQFLTKAKSGVPFVGTFPQYFTNFNFQSFARILPELRQSQLSSLAFLEQNHQEMREGSCKEELGRLLTIKRDSLKQLESLSEPPAAASPG